MNKYSELSPPIPLFKVHVPKDETLSLISEVIDSGFVNEGIQVSELNKCLESFLGVEKLVLTNSGTSALTIALRVAGVETGTEVITISMTCIASNTPIINLGAKIVWADIDPKAGSIDVEDVKKKISNKTRAILFVAWAGNPCNLKELKLISDEYGIPLIQDAAHAFGATWDGNSIAEHSDFTCFSFQAIKHFTTGDGGAIVCKSEKDYLLARKLKWFGYDRNALKDDKGEWKGQRWDADILEGGVGYKFNMNNLAAAIGLAQLPYIQGILNKHRSNAARLTSLLAESKEIEFLELPREAVSSNWVLTVRVRNKSIRDRVIEDLNKDGISAGLVHLPNHGYSAFHASNVELPGTDEFAESQISLPCGWWVSAQDCERISKSMLNSLNTLS